MTQVAKDVALAVLIAVGALILVLTLVGAVSAQEAAACPEARQFESARATAMASAESGKFTSVAIMETTAEVDEFLAAINETYGRNIPLGKADKAISFIITQGGAPVLMAFGYRDGCQVGFLSVRPGGGTPGATSPSTVVPRRYGV